MKLLQWALAIIGTFALAIAGMGLAMPSKFAVSRTIAIRAPADKVYDYIADPRNWKLWSVWHARDPGMDVTYSGPDFGQGAKWSWKSETEGSGQMEFTRVEPNNRVEYALFLRDFNLKSSGAFTVWREGEATRVTWSNAGDVGSNPLKHYLAVMMDDMVGPDFEAGLANLKKLAEKP